MRILKNILPWLICIAIFAYLGTQIHPAEIAAALQKTNIPVFIFYAVVYFMLVYVIDSLALWYFLNRFTTPISLLETFILRGASYLFMIVNYNAGQGAMAIYLRKTHSASVSRTLGTVFFITAADLILVIASAFVALCFADVTYRGVDISAWAKGVLPIIFIAYAIWVIFWRRIGLSEIGAETPQSRSGFLKWLLKHGVFHTFREARFHDHVLLFASRLPLLVIVLGAYNFALFSFGAALDWLTLFLYNPVIMLIGALPLTPSGLGTSQVMTIEVFKNAVHGPVFTAGISAENILLTSSLLWFLANQILKAIVGTICLRRTSRTLFQDADSTTHDNV